MKTEQNQIATKSETWFSPQVISVALAVCVLIGFGLGMGFGIGGSEVAAQVQERANADSAVLVELFTSEGCSSCPPADDNLKRLAELAKEKGLPIYTLSYHVDYWDYLGWKDVFSSAEASDRQRKYSTAFHSDRIYTPQFVVNGQWEFVGSNRTHTQEAIVKAMEEQYPTKLSVTAKTVGANIQVQLSAPTLAPGNRLVVALAQNAAKTKVARGENARRTLQHVNIVRDFKELNAKTAMNIKFTKPADFVDGGFHVLAYVQSAKNMNLVAIQKAEIE